LRRYGVDPMTGRVRHVLAVLEGREDDSMVIESAHALASKEHARLTAIRFWTIPPWMSWVGMAGIQPVSHVREIEDEALRALRETVAGLPGDVPVTLICQRGTAVRGVAEHVLAGQYQVLVLSGRALGLRVSARLRRRCPDLRAIGLWESSGGTRSSRGIGRASRRARSGPGSANRCSIDRDDAMISRSHGAKDSRGASSSRLNAVRTQARTCNSWLPAGPRTG
jgi:hypothetical protein